MSISIYMMTIHVCIVTKSYDVYTSYNIYDVYTSHCIHHKMYMIHVYMMYIHSIIINSELM